LTTYNKELMMMISKYNDSIAGITGAEVSSIDNTCIRSSQCFS